MKAFKVTGTFKMGSKKAQPFTREVIANNQNQAKEKTFSDLGSRHKIKRNFIKIDKVKEISTDEVESPFIKGLLEQG
jgi:large subunit ribosomal protein LX